MTMGMEGAYVLAAGSGVLFGLHDVVARGTGLRESPHMITFASIVSGYPAVLVAAVLWGPRPMPLEALAYYASAGLVNFNLGRMALYVAIRELGASGASVMTSLTLAIGMALGAALGERILPLQVLGASLIFAASLMVLGIGVAGRPVGVVAGVTTATCMALAIVLARLGNLAGGDPIHGVLVAYTVAMLGELATVRRGPVFNRGIAFAGLLASIGQIARYEALSVLGASVVAPLHNVRPIIATLTTRSLARYTLERPTYREYIGAVTAFLGATVMYLGG